MSIQITQTCDACGQTRDLSDVRNAQDGGWRDFGHGWICTRCLRGLIDGRAKSKTSPTPASPPLAERNEA